MHARFTPFLVGTLALAAAAGAAPEAPPDTQRSLEAQVIITSKAPINQRERIAVPVPAVKAPGPDGVLDRAASELHQVLWDDLRYSGVFDVVPRELYAAVPATTSEKVPYEEWSAIAARWLALVEVSSAGGELVVEGRLFETQSDRKMVLGKRYQAPLSAGRQVAHKLADAVIELVGGAPGVCQTSIAFVSDRDGGRDREVYVMDYDGHQPSRVTGNRKLNMSPDWSPGNDRIAYTSYIRGNPDLYILSRTGGQNQVLFAKPGMNSSPAWSPDGRTIAFASTHQDQDSEIYTIRPDGSGLARLTRSRGIDTNPAWAPNGRQIAFTSDRSGRPQVWLMDAEGLNLRRVSTQGPFNDGAAWAPAGREARLAFAGMTGGQFQIFVYSFDTGELVQLTFEGSNEAPSWSPDGRQIAFASTRGGKTDIYVMNDDGTNLRRITSGGNNLSPAWSHRQER